MSIYNNKPTIIIATGIKNTKGDILPETGKVGVKVVDASVVGVGVLVSVGVVVALVVGVGVDVWARTEVVKRVKAKTTMNRIKKFLYFLILN